MGSEDLLESRNALCIRDVLAILASSHEEPHQTLPDHQDVERFCQSNGYPMNYRW